MARTMFIPPGGVAGFSAQTPAVRALLVNPTRPRRKKRTTKKKTTRRRRKTTAAPRRRTTRGRKPARLVKGSAAAKRHMAKLRRMRGKKR